MKMNKRFVSFLMVLSFVMSMALISPLGAEAAAQALELNASVNHTVSAADEVVTFTFTPAATDRYGIYVTDPSAVLTVSRGGSTLFAGEPFYDWGLSEVQAELTAGVEYTIRVSGLDPQIPVDIGVTDLYAVESLDILAYTETVEGYVDSEVAFQRLLEVEPAHADMSAITMTTSDAGVAQCDRYGSMFLVTFVGAGEAELSVSWDDTVFPMTARASELKELPLGQELTVTMNAGQSILGFDHGYAFVPQESGTYTFYVRGDATGMAMGVGLYDDPIYCVYVPSWDANVLCTRLEAGKTYRISLSAGQEEVYTAGFGVVKAPDITDIAMEADAIRGDSGVKGYLDFNLSPVLGDISGLQVQSSDESVVTAYCLDETLYYSLWAPGAAELTVSCGQAQVTIPVTVSEAAVLVPGLNEIEPREGADSLMFTFTPEKTGSCRIWSETEDDVYVAVYDAQKRLIASDDDSGTEWNFDTDFGVQAGQLYYVEVEFWTEPTQNLKIWLQSVSGVAVGETLTGELGPGETATYTFTADTVGVYDFYTLDTGVELECQSDGKSYWSKYREAWQSTDVQVPLATGESCTLTVHNTSDETRQFNVTLVQAAQPESVEITEESIAYFLGGEGVNLSCTVMPAHADCTTSLRWYSDGLTVYNYGDEAVAYPEAEGTYTVTLLSGTLSDAVRLTVIQPPVLKLDGTVDTVLAAGGSTVYTFTAEEAGVYGFYTTSQDVSLYTVNADGSILGYDTYVPAWGVSELQVRLAAGESCTVQVRNYTSAELTVPVSAVKCTEPESLSLATSTLYLRTDGTVRTLVLDVQSPHSILPQVEARSSDGSVVYVEYYGLWLDVMGLSEGTASLYVTAGDRSWEIPVIVSDVIRGDVDDNGYVDAVDAMLVRQYVALWELENFIVAAADVNDDGVVDGADALSLRSLIAG